MGRTVGRIFVGNADVDVEMVRRGFAARDAGVGLWADKTPVKPWDWRKGVRPSPYQLLH
jgi:endonuclease YncB( thermonuclease family)